MKKIEKMSNVIFVILRAFQVISIVGAILCVIVCVASLHFDQLSPNISINLGYVTLDVIEDIFPTMMSSQSVLVLIVVMYMIILGIAFMVLQVLCKVFDLMRKGHPFEESVPSNIRKIALIVLCGGTVYEISKIAFIAYLTNMINITEILLNEYVQSVNVDLRYNLIYVVFAILLWLIAYIFDYGVVLQQEADETL